MSGGAEPRGGSCPAPCLHGDVEVVSGLKDEFKKKTGLEKHWKGVGESLTTYLVESEERE